MLSYLIWHKKNYFRAIKLNFSFLGGKVIGHYQHLKCQSFLVWRFIKLKIQYLCASINENMNKISKLPCFAWWTAPHFNREKIEKASLFSIAKSSAVFPKVQFACISNFIIISPNSKISIKYKFYSFFLLWLQFCIVYFPLWLNVIRKSRYLNILIDG